jgi:hypothetical protein
MSMIVPDSAISDWRDLQIRVRDFFQEMGYETEIEKPITKARGETKIDVWIEDPTASVNTTYFVECKLWKRSVPSSVVRDFRSTMSDAGANTGFIIARVGFQSGAYDEAKYTNIHLLTWEELQRTYGDEWLRKKCSRIEELCNDWEAHIHFDQEVGRLQNQANVIFHTPELIEEFRRLRVQGIMLSLAVGHMPNAYDREGPLDMPCDLSNPEFAGISRVESVREYFEILEPALKNWLMDFRRLKKRAQESFSALSSEDKAMMTQRALEAFASHRNFPIRFDAIP